MTVKAMERCTYCRRDVPVTWHTISDASPGSLTAHVAVCEGCFEDGR